MLSIDNITIKKPVVVTGLDIGSSKVSAVSCEIGLDLTFRILGQITLPSRGVRRGAITDLAETTDCVSMVLSKLSGKINKKPGDIYVSVSGQGIKGERSKGMIPLSLRGREVNRSDMDRCANVASVIRLSFDREIIHRIVHNYSVDDNPWIKNPLGLYASRLACEIYVITCDINHIQNINKCVNNAGYDVKEVVYSGIANGAGLLEPEDSGRTVIILDMGSEITEVSVFSSGSLNDLDIIPSGSADINGNFRDSIAMNDTFARVAEKVGAISLAEKKAPRMVVTGGLAFADGIVEYAEEKLTCPIKMGVVKDIRGDISGLDSVRLSTALGLTRYAYSKYRKKTLEEGNIAKRVRERVVDIFNYYF